MSPYLIERKKEKTKQQKQKQTKNLVHSGVRIPGGHQTRPKEEIPTHLCGEYTDTHKVPIEPTMGVQGEWQLSGLGGL